MITDVAAHKSTQHPIRDLTDHKDLDNMIPVIAKMVMSKGSKISYH